jgi:hypothetical protein
MRAGLCVDELRIDAKPALVSLNRAFERVANAERLADLFGVDISALVGKSLLIRLLDTPALIC